MDNTIIHSSSRGMAHHVDLHLWRGAPKNLDESKQIQILVNQGYVVGFCPELLQPAWSAYRVAFAQDDVKYERPLMYYNDMRLDADFRIGARTFGKLGGIQLNVGHMTPNEVINRQFGRLAQMETFLMSNMSPQYASLNSGVWLKLETAIREIEDEAGKDHVWVIVGPIFGEVPNLISRGANKKMPIPDSYFCLIVDPHSYPYNTPSRVQIDCFVIPQTAPRDASPLDYPSTIDEIESLTNLEFFDSFGRDIPLEKRREELSISNSRIVKILKKNNRTEEPLVSRIEKAKNEANSIEDLIDCLKDESVLIKESSIELSQKQLDYLSTIQHTISWLNHAKLMTPSEEEIVEANDLQNFITYKIEKDLGDRLKKGVRTACNFWNRFIIPGYNIVVKLDTYNSNGNTIARAYKPFEKEGVRYGVVEFNTKYLSEFSDLAIVGTLIHEIGHTLGIGWKEWEDLFDSTTGKFHQKVVDKLVALGNIEVELDYGPGTALVHWDEAGFDRELMTGFQDDDEFVLPVTIDIMSLLGHEVIERLGSQRMLSDLINEVEGIVFSKQNEVKQIDLDYHEETELFETIPAANNARV